MFVSDTNIHLETTKFCYLYPNTPQSALVEELVFILLDPVVGPSKVVNMVLYLQLTNNLFEHRNSSVYKDRQNAHAIKPKDVETIYEYDHAYDNATRVYVQNRKKSSWNLGRRINCC